MQKPVTVRRKSPWIRVRRHWQIYLMMLPGLVLVLLFAYLPMAGLTMCFNDFNPILGIRGFWESEWVGFQWFEKFMDSFYFGRIMRNTLLINLAKLLCGFWVPIVFALLLNEERNLFFKKTVQTVSYMPYFISWVVTIALMDAIFSPTMGLINNWRAANGLNSIYFMGEERYFYPMIIGSSIWKGFGWSSIIYLAAISGISIVLMAVALMLTAAPEKEGRQRTSKGFVALCCAIFLINGSVSIGSYIYSNSPRALGPNSFLISRAAILCVVSVLGWCAAKAHGGAERLRRRELPVCGGLLFCATVLDSSSYFLQLVSAAHLSSTVLYPVITGGTIVLTALAGRLLFREKPGRRALIGTVLSFFSTLLFAF